MIVMKNKLPLIFCCVLLLHVKGDAQQKMRANYVSCFENINHPEVAYWFFTSDMLPEARYKSKIDSFAQDSKYTLIFLTARNGCDFYDTKAMHPVFEKLVDYAHQKGLRIGLQIWKNDEGVLLENTDRLIQEGEVILGENGNANYSVIAEGARYMHTLLKSDLFKIYAFRKTGDGFYDSSTLRDITSLAKVDASINTVNLSVNAGSDLKGFTAYILTQHYYSSCSNFSAQAKSIILNVFKAYADIPFDGIGLDEYKNMTIARQPVLKSTHRSFRERVYSIGMAQMMKATTGSTLDAVLFEMRYAPQGSPAVRIRAINEYMSLLRTATLGIETSVYELGKEMYGKDAFIGLHNTFHNNLDGDEVWQTGVSWWNIKRDYGHTDEKTPLPIQMGIGMCNKENIMYNMYYDRHLEKIWTKALYDLRFGVRTHYHAANDVQGWGVSIDGLDALQKINKVENCARLLNRFNPPFPKIKLLVVYGMEALFNWYPDKGSRGLYDINDKLGMEEKSVQLWDSGYLNAAVPTDIIENGKLTLNEDGKPVLNGYVFDAVVFLYPQYSKEATTKFFQYYVNAGGKLLIEGNVTKDFYGKDIESIWKEIADKAVATSFSMENIKKLGVARSFLTDGVQNGEGSYTFTNIESLQKDTPVSFSFTDHGNTFTGIYKGMAAISVDAEGGLRKLAVTAFSSLHRNGKEILRLNKPADLFISVQDKKANVTIADSTKMAALFQIE